MKKIFLAVATLGLTLTLVCPESMAQNRRTSAGGDTKSSAATTATTSTTTTSSRSTTNSGTNTGTSSGTTTTRRTSGTSSQPAASSSSSTQTRQNTTTTTRQNTTATRPASSTGTTTRQNTASQPANQTTTTTAPGGRRNSTTTTTTTSGTTTKQNVQPQQPASQPTAKPESQPAAQQPAKPAAQPSSNGGTTMRPGGSTTHQNSNGNVTRPNGKTPTTGQPQNYKPQPAKPGENMTKGGKPVTPGYKPDALKVKPPKQPVYHKNRKPRPPKPFFEAGYHQYGVRINILPKGHTIRYVNKVKYYYHNGVFYRSNNLSGYIVCRPPKGYSFDYYSVNFLPVPILIDPYRDQATRIAEAVAIAQLYASYYPSYRPYDESYYINNVLASSAYQYYTNDGAYFIESGGRFSVVDAPLGAVLERLPYDYEEVYLGNDLFYLVDNVLYGVICPEGIPYFEVFCVL